MGHSDPSKKLDLENLRHLNESMRSELEQLRYKIEPLQKKKGGREVVLLIVGIFVGMFVGKIGRTLLSVQQH